MKKLIALLAVCGFAFAFVACGGQKKEEAATEPETEQTAPAIESDTLSSDTTDMPSEEEDGGAE